LKKSINILSKEVINQIAAGEVIQRPASIVKELIENSIDAGAKKIEIIIKDAGKTLVQLIDDGIGMNNQDATICFQKHTTSKIKNITDVMSISTMGFRGEALASISSIAKVELKTKREEDEIGTLIHIENSIMNKNLKVAISKGTSIAVKNLFFNVPARKKFLKSDRIEMKHILEVFMQLSIANCEIEFKLNDDSKTLHHLKATNLKQRIIQLFGSRYNQKILPIKEETSIVSINGFIGNPFDAKKTRGEQFLYVNNRFIKSSYLNHAVKNSMHNIITNDQHPSYFIFLSVDPKTIDVNIHPNKTEIKFEDEKSIYQILKSACKKPIGMYNITPSLDFTTEESFEIPIDIQKSTPKEPKIKINSDFNPFLEKNEQLNKKTPVSLNLDSKYPEINIINCMNIDENYGLFTFIANNSISCNLIDKKRALERIIYETTLTQLSSKKFLSQNLLYPIKLDVNISDLQIIENYRDKIEKVGYKFRTTSDKNLEITSTPTGIENNDIQDLFECFIEELKTGNINIEQNIIDKTIIKITHNKYRKSKSINSVDNKELKSIITKLLNCKTPFIGINGQPCVINIEPNIIFNN
tara:strand:- start:4672 stop:6423 length:1752 start_codon:yes stop_codon:yes gene_type:complete